MGGGGVAGEDVDSGSLVAGLLGRLCDVDPHRGLVDEDQEVPQWARSGNGFLVGMSLWKVMIPKGASDKYPSLL